MSRVPASHPAAGPECVCGAELKRVPLPDDLQALSGQEEIWVHAENGDTRCYPESVHPEDQKATAEPMEMA